MIDKFSMNRG